MKRDALHEKARGLDVGRHVSNAELRRLQTPFTAVYPTPTLHVHKLTLPHSHNTLPCAPLCTAEHVQKASLEQAGRLAPAPGTPGTLHSCTCTRLASSREAALRRRLESRDRPPELAALRRVRARRVERRPAAADAAGGDVDAPAVHCAAPAQGQRAAPHGARAGAGAAPWAGGGLLCPPAWRLREGPVGQAGASPMRSMAAQARLSGSEDSSMAGPSHAGPGGWPPAARGGRTPRTARRRDRASRPGASRGRPQARAPRRASRGRPRAGAPRPARGAHGRPWRCGSRRPRRPAARRPARARRPAARRPSAARTSPAWPPAARRSGLARPGAARRRLSACAGGAGPAAPEPSFLGSCGRAEGTPGRAAPARRRPGAPTGGWSAAWHTAPRGLHASCDRPRALPAGWRSREARVRLRVSGPCPCRACCAGRLGRATRPRRPRLQGAGAGGGRRPAPPRRRRCLAARTVTCVPSDCHQCTTD
jgi:hypothetical protein